MHSSSAGPTAHLLAAIRPEPQPTTLAGLLLFVVLLLPGFAYLVGKERNGTERHTSPFRETVAIVAASVTSEIAVLVAFAVVRSIWPSRTPDVGAMVRNAGEYLRGDGTASGRYGEVAGWAVSLLAVATVGAYLAANAKLRRALEHLPAPSLISAMLFVHLGWHRPRGLSALSVRPDHLLAVAHLVFVSRLPLIHGGLHSATLSQAGDSRPSRRCPAPGPGHGRSERPADRVPASAI
jgi:Family of unknown function (DUF6338)